MKKKRVRRSTLIAMPTLIRKIQEAQQSATPSTSLMGVWRDAVDDPALFANARPHRVDQAALIVHVSAPAWAARIRLSTPSLLSSLKSAGLDGIDRLDVKVIPEGFESVLKT